MLWFFTELEATHENAAIGYSGTNIEQFDALSELASEGLIPGVRAILVPSRVPVPFRDYSESLRLDWTQSATSSWFLRGSRDSYSTRNNLVQQATLPSTGLSTRNGYWNVVVGNESLFSPESIGSFTLG